ncbi:MAG: type II toxin-antitoxin system PemK/MazF family toxin [SAR202 cluster bacterium]|nr:type II toxin-antitoxin system PemK/MazF family toxin [SAR202 cluster bacterium]
MTAKRGEVWVPDLDPIRGSEQAGTRPVLIIQNNLISRHTTTVIAVPLTTNLRCAPLPSSVMIPIGEAGLRSDSVALCNQIRAIDSSRLTTRLGVVTQNTLTAIDECILFTTGMDRKQ